MSNNFQFRSTEEIKDENEFLKMKLMLEKGARFGASKDVPPMPPELENRFLKEVMAIESMCDGSHEISIYEKIGKPSHFKPIEKLNEEELKQSWDELLQLFNSNGINLIVFSPNTSLQDLYRFSTTEFMNQKIDDYNFPGTTYNFFYDDFHPDPFYESSRLACDECMTCILNKKPFDEPFFFSWFDLQLNEHKGMLLYEFSEKVNNFKQAYDNITILSIEKTNCSIHENLSVVEGIYAIELLIDNEVQLLKGTWSVTLECKQNLLFWYVKKVMVEGLRF
jgi:hypothetical protein